MKKFGIIFSIIIIFIGVGVFSTSFGNEETETQISCTTRNSQC